MFLWTTNGHLYPSTCESIKIMIGIGIFCTILLRTIYAHLRDIWIIIMKQEIQKNLKIN